MNYELYTTKHWMILPSFVHGILPTLMYNSNNHIAISVMEKKKPYLVAAGGGEVIRDAQVTEDGEVIPRRGAWGENLLAMMKEPFVNVIPIDGPITRNGDACSYGSKDIRDWLMEAAGNEYCRAHVLVVNTPGGSAWAKNDFQQAIDYAHERGQRVYMLIDGLCASAGMYLASFCDEVYVVNLKDQLGCVGVMASFFTIKNGEKNQFGSETYHEYYATKSVNKNKEYRDIAENDDATLLIAELDKLEDEFRKDMQAAFPDATDEHLDGKVFYAEEVMGILCDGQMLLGDVVARAFAVANGDEEPIGRTANRDILAPEEEPDGETSGTVAEGGKAVADATDTVAEDAAQGTVAEEGRPAAAAQGTVADADAQGVAANGNDVSPKNNMKMNEKYQKIAQLLGVDELVVTEEGTFLNTPLLDKLSEKLDEMQNQASAADATGTVAEGTSEEAGTVAGNAGVTAEGGPVADATGTVAEEGTAGAVAEGTSEEAGTVAKGEAPAAEPGEPADLHFVKQGKLDEAQEEIDKISETLQNAETAIADKDKTIAGLKEALQANNATTAERDKTIEELNARCESLQKVSEEKQEALDATAADLAKANDTIEGLKATIEAQKKQLAEKESEIKELADKPAPMTDSSAGVPAGNGTGEAPKQKQCKYQRGMGYKAYLATAAGERKM